MPSPAPTQAESFFEALQSYLRDEESVLLEGETLVILHSTSGTPVHIDTIMLYNPSSIAFIGRDMTDGMRSSVFAHVSSIQIQFRVVKLELKEPREPIGFVIAGTASAESDEQ
ncbi:MAG: hypothetical protein WBW88_19540 [Rhodothermales bacterium]